MDAGWTAENFVGGDPALDFLNTAGGRTRARDAERLESFNDVVAWADVAGVLGPAEIAAVRGEAKARPAEAGEALVGLKEQREALHATLLAVIEEREPPRQEIARLERSLRAAYAAARLDLSGGRRGWRVDGDVGVALIAHRLALAAGALVGGGDLEDVRICSACSWMFLDRTPSKRRRWCSMAACGNRAKASRHYRRTTS